MSNPYTDSTTQVANWLAATLGLGCQLIDPKILKEGFLFALLGETWALPPWQLRFETSLLVHKHKAPKGVWVFICDEALFSFPSFVAIILYH